MASRFLVLFLFISHAQAISSSHLQTLFTSESRGLNHTSGQMQEFLGKISSSFSNSPEALMKDKTRLDEKVEQRKNELSDTLRKARGGGKGGSYGGANMNHRPRPIRSSATSLLQVPCFWVSNVTPFVLGLALIFVFPFN